MAWKLVQSNFAVWIPSVLLTLVVMYAITLPLNFGLNALVFGSWIGPKTQTVANFLTSMAMGMIPGLITNVFTAGLLYMGVKVARNETIGIGDIFGGFRQFLNVVVGMFLMTLIFYVGFALFIIPGIFLSGALCFVPLLILDRNMSPIEAISASYETLKQHAFQMFGLVFIAGLLSALGFCLCGFGVLFTMPIYIVTLGLTYNNFFPQTFAPGFGHQIGVEPPK